MDLVRLGHVFAPTGDQEWARSHASTPFAVPGPDDTVEVYFSSRDSANRSHLCATTLQWSDDGARAVGQPRLLLSPGSPGAFDQDGLSMGSIIEVDGATHLYYVGWSLRADVPWQNTIGLAVRAPGDTVFRKVHDGPVLDVSTVDQYSMSYPWVSKRGDQFEMWYGTNLTWGPTPADMQHAIRRADSSDGIHWQPDLELALDLRSPDEYALARPSVWWSGDGSRRYMMISRRTRSQPATYDLALAVSVDGVRWTRTDDLVHMVGERGVWESEMSCYATVFEMCGEQRVLYCGNGFGRTGFGAARIAGSLDRSDQP